MSEGGFTEWRIIIRLGFLGEGSLGFGGFAGESLSWGVGQRISTGGTGLLEVLGTGARISIWYPGARKLS
jgi:hypothetical protein